MPSDLRTIDADGHVLEKLDLAPEVWAAFVRATLGGAAELSPDDPAPSESFHAELMARPGASEPGPRLADMDADGYISFDPDEEALAYTANSRYVGADRIVWASDYPHPDAKIPGVVDELEKATASLDDRQRRLIFGENAARLYQL